ncbi:MAG: hypothetical protein HY674_07710 [Chloroflexi bacterium]|nr:hypothetical protein [Chloroflexota bacterium]
MKTMKSDALPTPAELTWAKCAPERQPQPGRNMNHCHAITRRFLLSVLPALVLAALGQTPAFGSALWGKWNLGEDDPGAIAGNIGNPATKDAVGTHDLTMYSAPSYSADVPAGGSALSMEFHGNATANEAYQIGDPTNPTLWEGFDLNNFHLSCDVKWNGNAGQGFSFPVSLGANGSGGASISILEIGTWTIHYGGTGASGGSVAVVPGTWVHLDLWRTNGFINLFVDGVLSKSRTDRPASVDTFFTIGGHENGTRVPGAIDGRFDGLIDKVVLTDLSVGAPPSIGGAPTVSPGKIYAGNSIILTAAGVAGDATGKTHFWRANGIIFANTGSTGTLFINNATTNNAGNYDLVVTNNYGAATSSIVAVSVLPSGGADVMRFRMGENDPGAVAGNPGNAQTVDAILGNNLDAFGAPFYSDIVPAGGGTFSLAFDGFSYYRNSNLAAFLDNLDQANYSIACDVYSTALGGAGFSFPFSLGRNGGGIGIVEIGGIWHFIRMGVGTAALGPVELNTWTHFEIQRRDFDTQPRLRVFVNGQDANFQATSYSVASPILTVGANTVGDGENVEGYFAGLVDNVIIRNYSIGAPPTITSGPTASPDTTLITGETLTLSATIAGGTPASYRWRRDGTVLTNDIAGITSTVAIPNALAGNYDVIVSNSPAAVVTSSIVAITIVAGPEDASSAIYNLGEQDPGAADGIGGNALTMQANGIKHLTRYGTPAYTRNVPPGGSALAMSLNGFTDWYAGRPNARWSMFLTNGGFLPEDFSLSGDVYPTGEGADGFSIALSLGHNGPWQTGGAIFLYHAGGTWRVHVNGVGDIIAGPEVALNSWTHLELVHKDFGAGLEYRLLANGAEAGSATHPTVVPAPAFTIGAHFRNRPAGDPKPFEGYFKGLVDNVVLRSPGTRITLQLSGGMAVVDGHGKANTTYRLLVTPSLSPALWAEVTSGITDGNGYVQLFDVAPPAGQAYYRVVTP